MKDSSFIDLPADEEGYVSFECPRCGDRFKLHAGEYNDEDPVSLYCPLCGLSANRAEFLTKKVRDVAHQHADNMAMEAVHEIFKGLERKMRGNKFVRFETGPAPKKKPVPELREVTDLGVVEFLCCDRTAKVPHSDALSVTYCPYCGTEHV